MIINLTQHEPTPEQAAQGVVNLPEEDRKEILALLTFDEIPDAWDLHYHANKIGGIASKHFDSISFHGRKMAMIGGAPFFMSHLEKSLTDHNIKPIYAFAKRVSVEENINGEIRKVSIFKHVGFCDPFSYPVLIPQRVKDLSFTSLPKGL
jgi:hypothetical protein